MWSIHFHITEWNVCFDHLCNSLNYLGLDSVHLIHDAFDASSEIKDLGVELVENVIHREVICTVFALESTFHEHQDVWVILLLGDRVQEVLRISGILRRPTLLLLIHWILCCHLLSSWHLRLELYNRLNRFLLLENLNLSVKLIQRYLGLFALDCLLLLYFFFCAAALGSIHLLLQLFS